jgi:hypothetical protein
MMLKETMASINADLAISFAVLFCFTGIAFLGIAILNLAKKEHGRGMMMLLVSISGFGAAHQAHGLYVEMMILANGVSSSAFYEVAGWCVLASVLMAPLMLPFVSRPCVHHQCDDDC